MTMTTETVWLDEAGEVCAPGQGTPLEMPRLSAADAHEAVDDFVLASEGTDCPDDVFDHVATGCRILYRDDYDTGASWYQVVDEFGCGDGTGEWTPVLPSPTTDSLHPQGL